MQFPIEKSGVFGQRGQAYCRKIQEIKKYLLDQSVRGQESVVFLGQLLYQLLVLVELLQRLLVHARDSVGFRREEITEILIQFSIFFYSIFHEKIL